MKKLLGLVLVLALSGIAGAAVMFELDGPIIAAPGEQVTLKVISTSSLLSLDAKVSIESGAGVIVDAMNNSNAASYGWDPAGYPDNGSVAGTVAEFGGTQFNLNSAAVVGYVVVQAPLNGVTVVRLTNGYGLNCGDTLDGETFESVMFDDAVSIIVPEPATMALLALGGLLFRRK